MLLRTEQGWPHFILLKKIMHNLSEAGCIRSMCQNGWLWESRCRCINSSNPNQSECVPWPNELVVWDAVSAAEMLGEHTVLRFTEFSTLIIAALWWLFSSSKQPHSICLFAWASCLLRSYQSLSWHTHTQTGPVTFAWTFGLKFERITFPCWYVKHCDCNTTIWFLWNVVCH